MSHESDGKYLTYTVLVMLMGTVWYQNASAALAFYTPLQLFESLTKLKRPYSSNTTV